jgi:hypothetical protein
MTTYRDAVRRLQIIYNECAPQDAANNRKQVQDFDDFTLAKKRLHRDAKEVRDVIAATT